LEARRKRLGSLVGKERGTTSSVNVEKVVITDSQKKILQDAGPYREKKREEKRERPKPLK